MILIKVWCDTIFVNIPEKSIRELDAENTGNKGGGSHKGWKALQRRKIKICIPQQILR
jgi:hypothetical protein